MEKLFAFLAKVVIIVASDAVILLGILKQSAPRLFLTLLTGFMCWVILEAICYIYDSLFHRKQMREVISSINECTSVFAKRNQSYKS